MSNPNEYFREDPERPELVFDGTEAEQLNDAGSEIEYGPDDGGNEHADDVPEDLPGEVDDIGLRGVARAVNDVYEHSEPSHDRLSRGQPEEPRVERYESEEEVAKLPEDKPEPRQVRINAIEVKPPSRNNPTTQINNRPELPRIIAAAQKGETQHMTIRRTEPNGELSYEGSASLRPRGAEVTRLSSARAQAAPDIPLQGSVASMERLAAEVAAEEELIGRLEDEMGLDAEQIDMGLIREKLAEVRADFEAEMRATQPEPAPQFQHWARIRVRRHDVVQQQAKEGDAEPAGLRIEGVLSEYYGAFEIVIQGKPVDKADLDARKLEMEKDMYNSKASLDGDAKEQTATQLNNELTEGKNLAMLHRDIVVGADSPEALAEVADLVAASLAPDGADGITWEVERMGTTIVQYGTKESAIEAGADDKDAWVSARKFRETLEYPSTPVPGVGLREHRDFAVSRRIPQGEETITVGRIIDNQGNVVGRLPIPTNELVRHSIVLASSGSGKTVLLRELVTEAMAANREQLKQPGATAEDRLKTVIIDFEKHGNYDKDLADMLAGRGLSPTDAVVQRYTPGSDEGIRVNINLLRLTGNLPTEQMTIAVDALASGITDKSAEHVFRKYSGAAIRLAYEKMGWDMNTGLPKVSGTRPGIPDVELVRLSVEEVVNDTKFQASSKGDIGSYTESEIVDLMNGIPGMLFQDGYDIDWVKVRQSEGVALFELGHIKNPVARQVAATAIMRGLGAALDLENPTGDIDQFKMLVVMDETGAVFDEETRAGADNAAFWRTMRGKGIGGVIAQQKLKGLHRDVLTNTANFFGMKVTTEEDREIIAGYMSVPTEQLDELTAVKRGHGVYYGSDMDGPVRFVTDDPKTLRLGDGYAGTMQELLDRGHDRQFYLGDIKLRARQFLKENHTGNLIRAWAEINTVLVLSGRRPARLEVPEAAGTETDAGQSDAAKNAAAKGELHTALRAMLRDSKDALKCDAAITMAVEKAVMARSEITKYISSDELIDYLTGFMLNQVHADRPPTVPAPMVRLALPDGRYIAVRDIVHTKLTAPRLPEEQSQEFEKIMGRVAGGTAPEQRDNLDRMRRDAIAAVANILKGSNKESVVKVQPPVIQAEDVVAQAAAIEKQVAEAMSRHPGLQGNARQILENNIRESLKQQVQARLNDEAVERAKSMVTNITKQAENDARTRLSLLVGGHESLGTAVADVREAIETRLNRALYPHELETFDRLLNQLGPEAHVQVGYQTMRQKIEAHEAAHVQRVDHDPLDLSKWVRYYGREFPGETLTQKLASIDQAIEETKRLYYTDEIQLIDLFFPNDLLEGGLTPDTVVGKELQREEQPGRVFRAQDREENDGQGQRRSFVAMLRQNDPRARKWGKALSTHVIYSKNFLMPTTSKRFLSTNYSHAISDLRTRSKAARIRRARRKEP